MKRQLRIYGLMVLLLPVLIALFLGQSAEAASKPGIGSVATPVPTATTPVTQATAAPTTAVAAGDQGLKAKAVADDLMSLEKRTALQSSTNNALLMNMAMQKLVDDKKYNDKGLKEFRMALALQAMGAVKGLDDKPRAEEPKPTRNITMDDVAKRMGPNAAITGLSQGSATAESQHSSNPQSDESIAYVDGTPKDAAAFIKQRLKEDFTKSSLVPSAIPGSPNTQLQIGTTQGTPGAGVTTTTLLQKVDSLKPSNEVPQVGVTETLEQRTGRLLFDPAGRGVTSGNSAGISDTVPQIVDDETKQKIKLAAAEYLNKLAKAPNSKNPKDRALQMAIRDAKEDENVFDGLLNEVTDMLSNQAMLKVSTFTAGSMKSNNPPIEANPAFGGGRAPASIDPALEEETAIEPAATTSRFMPSGQKVPTLIVLATLLAILVFWSSQPKPKKAPYVPKGKRPLPGQLPRDMH